MVKASSIYLFGDRRSRTMDKLKTIDISGLSDVSTIMDKCHDEFKLTLANKENRAVLAGREVLVPLNWIDYKAEIFWHASSIEEKAKLDIQPCINDYASTICANNCIDAFDAIIMNNGLEREKCIYRAVRVHWIRAIIDMFNAGDSRVKYWEKINSDKKNRIYLRYQEEELDYLVVFDDKSEKKVRLITGYPIFFISAKRDYENDYQKYLKNKAGK